MLILLLTLIIFHYYSLLFIFSNLQWCHPAFAVVNVLIYAPENKMLGVLSNASCLLPGDCQTKLFIQDKRLHDQYVNFKMRILYSYL